ncbi:hypothetical protein Nepgr_021644 [Nepenthes gracilis]|uniref:Uncharacterized protein n=1 Tax=Nepenthes gracilis TaxID=150966 RepID=A0AAD3SX52_NEPGR|nr:hypothetical protein Nepgr_021644 [Nepenthes gracilis]
MLANQEQLANQAQQNPVWWAASTENAEQLKSNSFFFWDSPERGNTSLTAHFAILAKWLHRRRQNQRNGMPTKQPSGSSQQMQQDLAWRAPCTADTSGATKAGDSFFFGGGTSGAHWN